MIYQARIVSPESLTGEVQQLFNAGYRFVTSACVDEIEKFRVIYSFDKEAELVNLEVQVSKESEVPSISGIYLCAFLIENEMKELFGVNITNIAIDLGGHMFMTDKNNPYPMACNAKNKAEGGD
jgi:NADH:ubiquinone oxidoreductase 27 kD subunit